MNGLWQDLLANGDQLFEGLLVSLRLAFFTLLLGIPGGLVLAVASSARSRPVRWLAITLVELGRGTPALVMLQLIYGSWSFTAFVAAFIALGLTTAAYTSEIIRGGLQAVPDGEVEAAHALGLNRLDVMRRIVIPQGLRIALPPLLSFSIVMFQATSLAFMIAVQELMARAKLVADANFHYFNLFVLAGVMYAVITISASFLFERVERRLALHL